MPFASSFYEFILRREKERGEEIEGEGARKEDGKNILVESSARFKSNLRFSAMLSYDMPHQWRDIRIFQPFDYT